MINRTPQVLWTDEFAAALNQMLRSGGKKQKAGEKVKALIGGAQLSGDPFSGLRSTNHGEARIDHCIKYDLTGFARLVTVQDHGVCWLVFVGDHDDVDHWLEANKGLKLGRDKDGRWTSVQASRSLVQTNQRISAAPDWTKQALIQRLPEHDRDRLLDGVPGRLVPRLLSLTAGVMPEAILKLAGEIANPTTATLVFDVLVLLNSGDVSGAVARMDLESGALTPVSQLSPDEILEVSDGASIKRIPIGSPDYQKHIEAYLGSSHYLGWFLFMHPEQQRHVDADYAGPAKLSGVSGSGKTCVAVKRAIRLAGSSPAQIVGIITLNRSLATLIQRLVEYACPDLDTRKRIKVTSFFELCQELLQDLEPENAKLYHDVAWKAGDHIDEVFREYYRLENNNDDAACLLPLHRSLIAQSIDPESYVREELDWIRSAVRPDRRASYLDIERAGRKISILPNRRSAVLQGLEGWEKKMRAVGVVDYLGLTTALDRHFDDLRPRFNSIIVDEAQDFGTTELGIIRRLVPEGPNDLLLCGDLAQQILPKRQSYKDAGIDIVGARSFSIRRNYRNSREILKAAYAVLIENLAEGMLENNELELLDPELANFSTPLPMVLSASTLDDEIMYARSIIAQTEGDNPANRACIAIAGYTFLEISRFGKKHGIPVLDGSGNFLEAPCFLSDLEQTKGYEFETVVIVNCRDDVLPPRYAPAEEAFRHGCRLYVAMTRARKNLYLSYSGQVSAWLRKAEGTLHFDKWAECVVPDESLRISIPERLHQFGAFEDPTPATLTGRQFLFTPMAYGLSLEAQEKLDELVDGRGLTRGSQRLKWRNLSDLAQDLDNSPSARGIFGPKTALEISSRLSELGIAGADYSRLRQHGTLSSQAGTGAPNSPSAPTTSGDL